MNKTIYKIILVLTLCISCFEDDFVDTFEYPTYIIQVMGFYPGEECNIYGQYDLIVYETDGHGKLINSDLQNYRGITSCAGLHATMNTIKGYKTAGVKITATENVSSYAFFIQRTGDIDGIRYPVTKIEGPLLDGKITILYDFETSEITVE